MTVQKKASISSPKTMKKAKLACTPKVHPVQLAKGVLPAAINHNQTLVG
jgi:hypothetical protein